MKIIRLNLDSDSNTLIDEKRRLELRINELEGEFEEEQINSEINNEKLKRFVTSYEQAMLECNAEKEKNTQLEMTRSNLERQIRDLREKLETNDGSTIEQAKAKVAGYEVKMYAYEEQLDNEVRERQKAYRNVRLLEKRLREASTIAEETQKTGNYYKEEFERADARLRKMKRTVDELQEDLSQTKQRLRKAQREKDEIEETSYSRSRPTTTLNSPAPFKKKSLSTTKNYPEVFDDDLTSESTNANSTETPDSGNTTLRNSTAESFNNRNS
ncbi:unnamed protein product [Rotaria magnacalcarata]|uniref:Paramyosin n=1 Tax=Rotaria magnacalcarata TaxID=392030 RepID=A0A815T8V7_9BILA|nr:unnamed protein product [Rotaria magnacalcarata]